MKSRRHDFRYQRVVVVVLLPGSAHLQPGTQPELLLCSIRQWPPRVVAIDLKHMKVAWSSTAHPPERPDACPSQELLPFQLHRRDRLRPFIESQTGQTLWRQGRHSECDLDPRYLPFEQLQEQSVHPVPQCGGVPNGWRSYRSMLAKHERRCTLSITDWNPLLKTHRMDHDNLELECDEIGMHRIELGSPVQQVWLYSGSQVRRLIPGREGARHFAFEVQRPSPSMLTDLQIQRVSDVLAAAGHPGDPFHANRHLASLVNRTAKYMLPVLPAAHYLEDCEHGLSRMECIVVEQSLQGCIEAVARKLSTGEPTPFTWNDAVLRVAHLLIGALQTNRCLRGLSLDTDPSSVPLVTKAGMTALLFVLSFWWWYRVRSSTRARVMISYKHQDQEQAIAVKGELERLGLLVWIDLDIRAGKDWRGDIANAISKSHAVVFLMSPRSVTSPYCREEIYFAVSQDKPLYTIVLEEAWDQLSGGLKLVLMRFQCIHARDGVSKACRKVAQEVQELCSQSRQPGTERRVAEISTKQEDHQSACLREGVYLCIAEQDQAIAGQLAAVLRSRAVELEISQRTPRSISADVFGENASSIDKCAVFVALVTPLSARVSTDRGGFLDDVHYAVESKHHSMAPAIVAFDTRAQGGLEGSLGMMLGEDDFVCTRNQTLQSAQLELVIRVLTGFRAQLQPTPSGEQRMCDPDCVGGETQNYILPTQTEAPLSESAGESSSAADCTGHFQTLVQQLVGSNAPKRVLPLARTGSGRDVYATR
eukprot:TRINITY_DN11353_c0_g3_i4.p1 TRINITY_DN11353_c0_g3~~TRINITY_DN11353_c0_g3_i4.p1  ORF type:complete len:762 (-),score=107.72 TRINITY_DN11353_c0_g3_i4:48-2333(-)